MKKFVSELFEEVNVAQTQEERLKILRSYPYQDVLKMILRMALDPEVKFLPVVLKPYKPDKNPRGLNESNVVHQRRILNYFLESHTPRLDDARLATVLNTAMSALTREEGAVFYGIVSKNLSQWSIDWDLVQVYLGVKPPKRGRGRPKGSKNIKPQLAAA